MDGGENDERQCEKKVRVDIMDRKDKLLGGKFLELDYHKISWAWGTVAT